MDLQTSRAAQGAVPPSLSTELDRLTRDMAESTDWSDYHQADEQFHQQVGTASGLGTAVEAYHETLAELYAYFTPYPIELLHKSNCRCAPLRRRDNLPVIVIYRQEVSPMNAVSAMGAPLQSTIARQR